MRSNLASNTNPRNAPSLGESELSDLKILAELDDASHRALCVTNKRLAALCRDPRTSEELYRMRVRKWFGEPATIYQWKKKPANQATKWKRYYNALERLRKVQDPETSEAAKSSIAKTIGRRGLLLELQILGELYPTLVAVQDRNITTMLDEAAEAAAEQGNLSIIEYIVEDLGFVEVLTADVIARLLRGTNPRLNESREWLGSILLTNPGLDAFEWYFGAAEVGDLGLMNLIFQPQHQWQLGADDLSLVALTASGGGHVDMLYWLYENFGVLPPLEDLEYHIEQLDSEELAEFRDEYY